MVPLRSRSTNSAVVLLPPSKLPAKPPRVLIPPSARPAKAAIMAVLGLELVGGMMRADDLYCFGKVNAMSRPSASDTAATRPRNRRRSHKTVALVTQFGAGRKMLRNHQGRRPILCRCVLDLVLNLNGHGRPSIVNTLSFLLKAIRRFHRMPATAAVIAMDELSCATVSRLRQKTDAPRIF